MVLSQEEEKWSANIFRRGGPKRELIGGPHEKEHSDVAELNKRFSDMQQLWREPHVSHSGQSLAYWRPQHRAAEVTLERGHMMQRVGFRWRKKLYLHVEEAVFCMDRGSLLMAVELPNGRPHMVSLQEAYALLGKCGVSMEQFIVYSHFMRAGYIITRSPARWTVDSELPNIRDLFVSSCSLLTRGQAFVPLDKPEREVRSKVAQISQHCTGPAAAEAAETRLPDCLTGCVEADDSRPPPALLEQFGSVMAMEVDTEAALSDTKAAPAQQEQPALAALPDLQAVPSQAAAQASGSPTPKAAGTAPAAEEQAGPSGQGFPGFAAPAHTPAPAEAQPPWPSLPAWTPPPQAAGSKRGRDGDSKTLVPSQESEEELQDTPNQELSHHQQEAQPAKRAKRADGGTVVASIRVPFSDTAALQGATVLQRQLIVADFVAAALQAMAAEAGHPASSPSLAGSSARPPSPTGETTELTFTDAAGTSGGHQPETSSGDRAGANRTFYQESPLLGAGKELNFGPMAAAAAADAAAAAGGGIPAFGAAPDMGSCAKPEGAAGPMLPPAGLHHGLASSTPGGANYSPVPASLALHTGSPAGSQAATAGGGDATPSSSGPASVPATGGDRGATRWQPSRLQNMAVATDALEGQGAAERPKDKGAAEAGLTDGLDSSALPQRQCGRRRSRSQAGGAAARAAEPAAAGQQGNPAAPAPASRVPAFLAAAAAVPLPVDEVAEGGAVAEAQQALPSHAAASPNTDVSMASADGAQDVKPAEAAAPAPVSAVAAAEALGSSGLHEDRQDGPIVARPALKEEAAEGVWSYPADSANARAEGPLSTTEEPAAGQESGADGGGSKADEPADDGTPPEVQAILRQRQQEALTRRTWEQWLSQRLERQPWLLGGTGPSPGAVDTGKDKRLSLTSVFPRLRPFPFIKPEEPSAAFPGNCTMIYDIFGPNKSFSKTRPDQPAMHICLSHGARIPTQDEIAAVQRLARHPVYFAHVVAGDMSLQGLHRVELPFAFVAPSAQGPGTAPPRPASLCKPTRGQQGAHSNKK